MQAARQPSTALAQLGVLTSAHTAHPQVKYMQCTVRAALKKPSRVKRCRFVSCFGFVQAYQASALVVRRINKRGKHSTLPLLAVWQPAPRLRRGLRSHAVASIRWRAGQHELRWQARFPAALTKQKPLRGEESSEPATGRLRSMNSRQRVNVVIRWWCVRECTQVAHSVLLALSPGVIRLCCARRHGYSGN
jgi:hypothetical protein